MDTLTPWARALGLATLFAAVAVAAGCARSGDVAVRGRVRLDGQPVEYGSITLLPLEGQKAKSGALVQKGEFAIPARGRPPHGKYRVELHWPRPTGQKARNDDTGEWNDLTAEAFPPRYNSESTLTADLHGGLNELDFTNLKSR